MMNRADKTGLSYTKLKRTKTLPGDMVEAWLRGDDAEKWHSKLGKFGHGARQK